MTRGNYCSLTYKSSLTHQFFGFLFLIYFLNFELDDRDCKKMVKLIHSLYRIIEKNIIWNVSEKLDRNLNLSINGMSVNRSGKEEIKVLIILSQSVLYHLF